MVLLHVLSITDGLLINSLHVKPLKTVYKKITVDRITISLKW